MVLLCHYIVSLGTVPAVDALKDVPLIDNPTSIKDGEKSDSATMAEQVSTIMSLLSVQATGSASASKGSKVWLGAGLGTVSKKLYDKMLRWEFIDLSELRVWSHSEKVVLEEETQRVVVLPGFEVTQAKHRPVTDVLVWIQCFVRYVAAMALKYPGSMPGMMSHLLVVVRAASEVEGTAWRMYDEAFREKMAAKGIKEWEGMDVQLYQELCGGRLRKVVGQVKDGKVSSVSGVKRVGQEKRPAVCWLFNEGKCVYSAKCKFPHVCELCGASHPKTRCTGQSSKKPRFT